MGIQDFPACFGGFSCHRHDDRFLVRLDSSRCSRRIESAQRTLSLMDRAQQACLECVVDPNLIARIPCVEQRRLAIIEFVVLLHDFISIACDY